MEVELHDILALLGEKEVRIRQLEAEVARLQAQAAQVTTSTPGEAPA